MRGFQRILCIRRRVSPVVVIPKTIRASRTASKTSLAYPVFQYLLYLSNYSGDFIQFCLSKQFSHPKFVSIAASLNMPSPMYITQIDYSKWYCGHCRGGPMNTSHHSHCIFCQRVKDAYASWGTIQVRVPRR